MDTSVLLAQAKARFNHNSAKQYLKEKYEAKLLVAEQGGLWKAEIETINFLRDRQTVVLIDTFGNPVKVDAKTLYEKLSDVYDTVMEEWHKEWVDLESKR